MKFPLLEIIFDCPTCGGPKRLEFEEMPITLDCPECAAPIYRGRRVTGSIYVASNESMPGLFKIGLTTRGVNERLSELANATGVPTEFTLECLFYSDNPEGDETAIHECLSSQQVSNKEFFKAKRGKIIRVCEEVCDRPPSYVRDIPNQSVPMSNTPKAIRIKSKYICPRCGRRMRRLSKNIVWHCGECRFFANSNGDPVRDPR